MSPSYNKAHDFDSLNPLVHIASERVIVCTTCACAVPSQALDYHLSFVHRIEAHARRHIVAQFEGLPAAQTHVDLQPRSDRSAPLDYLLPPAPGFRCLHCTKFKTINWGVLIRHAKKEHRINAVKMLREKIESSCFFQRWTSCTREASSKYWIVDKELASNQGTQDPLPKPHGRLSSEADALKRIEAEEEQRLTGKT